MTSKYENFAAHYFLTRSLFLGVGFSLIIGITKQDSILAFLLGTLIGLFFILIIDKIQKYKQEKSLNEVLSEMKIIGILLKILFIIFGLGLICQGLTFMQLFAASFFLVKTPLWFISIPLIFLLIFIAQNGITTTFRVSSCLFPISVFLTLISLIALFGYADVKNVSPLFVSTPIQFAHAVFNYVALSVTPSLFMLVTKKSKSWPSYLFASGTLIVKIFLVIGIVGPVLASFYRFPEYIILKEIKLFNFIEKIENIVGLSWIFDIFVYLSFASLFVKELLPQKGNKIWHIVLLFVVYFLSILFVGKYYTHEIIFYYSIPIFISILFLITTFILFFYLRKKNSSSAI